MAFEQQRAERQRLAGRPVNAVPGVDRLAAVVEKPIERLVQVEVRRQRGDLRSDLLELCDLDAGRAAARIVGIAPDLKPTQRPSSQSALLGR